MDENNPRDERQRAVTRWAEETFGPVALDVGERATRLLEEAVEVAQAAGLTQAKAHAVLLHVYSKPEGVLRDEVGGVGVCLLALCETLYVSADDAERAEAERVMALPREHFRVRQNAKAGVAGRAAEGIPSPLAIRNMAGEKVPLLEEFLRRQDDEDEFVLDVEEP